MLSRTTGRGTYISRVLQHVSGASVTCARPRIDLGGVQKFNYVNEI
jgi:hypothetical protein